MPLNGRYGTWATLPIAVNQHRVMLLPNQSIAVYLFSFRCIV